MVLIRARWQERFDEGWAGRRVLRTGGAAVYRAEHMVGLLSGTERKNCWRLPEAAERRGRMGAAAAAYGRWDAEAVRTAFAAWSPSG